MLLACLAEQNIPPLYREAGLRPHVTLAYDPCFPEAPDMLREWIPDELLLIESEVGLGTHNVLKRWRLLPPPQGAFPFDNPPPPPPAPLLAAAG